MIVLANGCFDPLHYGHLLHLMAARAMGSRLVVALTSDRLVRLEKGASRPAVDYPRRAMALRELRSVDEVVPNDDADLCVVLRRVRPAVFVKGVDYVQGFPQQQAIEAMGIRVAFTHTEKFSSNALIGGER